MRRLALLSTSAVIALLLAGGPRAGLADDEKAGEKAGEAAAAGSPKLSADAPRPSAYDSVTQARLDKPEPGNWLMLRGNYQGWGYSPLDQVNASNVKNLEPVWTLSTGVAEAHQAPVIVNDGVMFVSTPQNRVLAVRADNGDLLWRYERQLPAEMQQL